MNNQLIDSVKKVIEYNFGLNCIRRISYLSSGRINTIFRVDLNDGYDFNSVVVRLRVFNDPEFGQNFGTEIMCDSILNNCVNYPILLHYDSSKRIIPWEYSILNFIEGRLFSVTDSPELFKRLGQETKKIHTKKVPPKYGSNIIKDIDGYYLNRFRNIISNCSRHDTAVYEQIKESLQYYYPETYSQGDISLTHHDIHERNIIVNYDSISFLDWESARVEATEVEFIRPKYYLFERTTPENIRAFFNGYGTIHFSDNFFIQEVMWLTRISNFEHVFPPSKSDEKYWCSSDYLNEKLEELMSSYRGKGSYNTIGEIFRI